MAKYSKCPTVPCVLCLAQYAKTRGWGAMYAGLEPMLTGTAASQGLYFYLYSAIRQRVAVSGTQLLLQ